MNDTPSNGNPPEIDELARLRELMLGEEADRLHRLDQRISDPVQRTGDVAEVLPGAMNRALADPVARPGMERPIVDTIRSAIKRDTESFAEALFPVLGPAIRRAVADALKSLVERINAALEHSFTAKGLRWRLEAARTGVPFGQIVLRETLRYAVQEVFLIQPESGLILARARRADTLRLDEDAFAAMLTAIQAFIRDSFGLEEDERLRSAELGDRTLWTINGPNAVLACVVLGSPPTEVREHLMETLEALHAHYGDEFDRPPEKLSDRRGIEALLEETLAAEVAEKASRGKGRSRLFWSGAALLALAWLCWLLWGAWQSNRLQSEIVRLLDAEPGYLVTGHEKRNGHIRITGLRDPYARSPADTLSEAGLAVGQTEFDFRSYASLEPALVLRRLQAAVDPGNALVFELEGPLLRVHGKPDPEQYARLQSLPAAHPLIEAVELPPREPRPDPGAERAARLEQFERALASVNGRELRFSAGTEFEAGGQEALDRLGADIRNLLDKAAAVDMSPGIRLEGFADGLGNAGRNREIALERARAVRAALARRGVDSSRVALAPGHWESGPENRALRKVVIHATREATP